MQIPTFLSLRSLAIGAGCHRVVVQRLVSQGVITVDAYGKFGATRQPMFKAERIDEVVRNVQQAK